MLSSNTICCTVLTLLHVVTLTMNNNVTLKSIARLLLENILDKRYRSRSLKVFYDCTNAVCLKFCLNSCTHGTFTNGSSVQINFYHHTAKAYLGSANYDTALKIDT
ncbi:hypothetical protein NPIL_209741 [Nephila pilipes]|uniref:Secreted protein n=1 Tax=Nephila pilipes TaxID=299642 RepID=A0A8X6U765_NEPPI|nr:hypothetical protein NPIL_209741 [Nephila pilipes]